MPSRGTLGPGGVVGAGGEDVGSADGGGVEGSFVAGGALAVSAGVEALHEASSSIAGASAVVIFKEAMRTPLVPLPSPARPSL